MLGVNDVLFWLMVMMMMIAANFLMLVVGSLKMYATTVDNYSV